MNYDADGWDSIAPSNPRAPPPIQGVIAAMARGGPPDCAPAPRLPILRFLPGAPHADHRLAHRRRNRPPSLTRTLRKFGDPSLVQRYLPALTTQTFDDLYQGAMFMTDSTPTWCRSRCARHPMPG